MPSRDIVAEALAALAGPDPSIDDATRAQALRLLLTRFSSSPKQLVEPGPSDDELAMVALAALRGPDRHKLIPFRFVVARGEALERLAELFVDYGRRRGKSDAELDEERLRATQAPVSVAVIARIDHEDPDVPAHEQWATVGGAIANALMALHILGYAGKMLSGARAADPAIAGAYCKPGETLVGWISIGTAAGPVKPRGEIDPAVILSRFSG